MKLNVRFAGAGGQGVILSSVLLAKAYGLGEDYNVSQTQSYGPEARGGACKAEVVVSNEDIDYMKVDDADVFIAYNQVGYDKYKNTIKKGAKVLVNSTLVENSQADHYQVPATEIAESMGKPFVVNMVMLGALTKMLPRLHYPAVLQEILKNFPESMHEVNRQAFQKGYQYLEERMKEETAPSDQQ